MKEYFCAGCQRYHTGEPAVKRSHGRSLCAAAVTRANRKPSSPARYRARQKKYLAGDFDWLKFVS
jgi:hypothetical protein